MKQQGGSSALGQTLEFCLQEVLLKAVQPRRKRALLAVVGTQTAYEDRAKLRYISQKAKCEGVAVFVATVGERYDRRQVEELASAPLQQHLIHLGRLRADEQGYGQRFFRVFLSALSKNVNSYPPALLKQTCSQLKDPDNAQTFVNDQESAALEEDVEKTPRQTQSRQLKFRRDSVASLLAAAKLRDACFLRQDAGGCQNYQLMWFFDSARRQCAPFWYSGCRGNRNRFASKEACESFCLRRSK